METRASKRRNQNLLEDKGSKDGKIDRMSERIRARSLDDFSEDILKHILTFLPTVDAVRTSLLSRKWQRRKLWRSLPFIDLDYSHFPLTPDDPSDACARFAEFIDQTLKRRTRFPVQKFHLHFDFTCYIWESKLDKWISYAISHKATYLDIDFSDTCPYDFNFGLLKNSCVQDVKVSRCELLHHDMSYLNLNSIRSVSLSDIILTDDIVVDLISWFNNLESLALDFCRGMKRLKICSSTLKKLSLEDSKGSSLEICCPNLNSIRISNFKMKKYCMKNSASLVEADIHFFAMDDELSDVLRYWSKVVRILTSVKRLTTQNNWFQLLCKKDASDCFVFTNLNQLELWTGYGKCDLLGMAALLKICPNITTLTLDFSLCRNEHNDWVPVEFVDIPIEFSIPNLKILNVKTSGGITKIMELVELMKKYGAALEKIVLWEQNGKRSSIPV